MLLEKEFQPDIFADEWKTTPGVFVAAHGLIVTQPREKFRLKTELTDEERENAIFLEKEFAEFCKLLRSHLERSTGRKPEDIIIKPLEFEILKQPVIVE